MNETKLSEQIRETLSLFDVGTIPAGEIHTWIAGVEALEIALAAVHDLELSIKQHPLGSALTVAALVKHLGDTTNELAEAKSRVRRFESQLGAWKDVGPEVVGLLQAIRETIEEAGE